MNNQHVGAVIFAKDIYRVADFYQAMLGLEVRERDDGVVRLEGGCLQLVIHNLPKPVATRITIDTPPKRRSDTAIKPVFFVDDIEELRKAVAQQGGDLNPLEKVWEFDGHKVCDGCDPEGNVFQLRAEMGNIKEDKT